MEKEQQTFWLMPFRHKAASQSHHIEERQLEHNFKLRVKNRHMPPPLWLQISAKQSSMWSEDSRQRKPLAKMESVTRWSSTFDLLQEKTPGALQAGRSGILLTAWKEASFTLPRRRKRTPRKKTATRKRFPRKDHQPALPKWLMWHLETNNLITKE